MADVTTRFSELEDRLLLLLYLEEDPGNRTHARGDGREDKETRRQKRGTYHCIIDAQSDNNTLVSSESRGFDAGKKVKGVKRHMIVDSLGLILAIVIQSASVQDRDGAVEVVEKLVECWKKVIKIFADGGYTGKLIEKIKKRFKITVEIIKRTENHMFKVLPKRWIVERTLAWLETNRRNAKYYERLNDTGVAMVQLSAIRIMIKRF